MVMKKILVILGCMGVLINVMACGSQVNIQKSTKEESIKEKRAIEEEKEAFDNLPMFDCSVEKMKNALQKNFNLKQRSDKNLCIFEDKDGKFEIQIGQWKTNISEIYFTIYGESPFDDSATSTDFMKSVEDIFSVLSEEVDKNEIEKEFSQVTKPDQTVEFNYSKRIKLFVGKMGDDYDFRIYPQADNDSFGISKNLP